MDELLTNKQFLIDNNTSKWKDTDKLSQDWSNFERIFKLILKILKDNNKIQNDKERLIVIDSLSIWFLRVTQLLKNKKLVDHIKLDDLTELIFPNKSSESMENSKDNLENVDIIFDYIIDFWNDSNNSIMTALKDLFNKLLIFLKIICNSTKLDGIMNHWLDEVLKLSSALRIKYYFLEILSQNMNVKKILVRNPDFITESLQLMSSGVMANNVGKCLVYFLQNIYLNKYDNDESKLDDWLQIWYNHVLNYLHSQELFKSINLYFLQPLFKLMPSKLFQLFMNRISHTNDKSRDPVIILSLLKVGQELGLDEEPFHNDRLVSLNFLTELLKIDQFKLTVFQILTFSKKKSKLIQPYIFDILQQNWNIFFVDVNFETRTYFESSLKNFILRVRDSTYSLSRDANKLAKANKFPEEQKEKLEQIELAKKFITKFYQYLLNSIIPGIHFQKISLSLSMVNILLDSGLDENVEPIDTDKNNIRAWPYHLPILTDKFLLRLLIDNLNNNLNDVRSISKDIIIKAFNNQNEQIGQTINNMIKKENISEKARKNMNAYQNTEIGATLELFLFGIATNQRDLINEQIEFLRKEIELVKNDPLTNAQNNISASFTTLTMFLDSFDQWQSKQKTNNDENSSIIDDIRSSIWEQIENSWQWSQELMCHDSADGLLPTKYLNSNLTDRVVTSYAFKAVKESSQLIDILLLKYRPTVEDLDKIGQYLIEQLFSIRHSGAFHAVLPTFRTFCIKCRQLAPEKLENWLNSILESLEVKTQHITRRSGGLPYLITNILSTEVDKERPQLNKVFNKLLKIIKTSDEVVHQDKLDLPQVNAFNCIKAIFIEAKLSDACTPFFPIALQYSLKYFKSEIWALRNCSLMLFTSLQIRIFGKNGKSVSARLFFTKYNEVKDILLNILRESLLGEHEKETTGADISREVESIFLVLNILMCLKQTPGYDGLKPFILEVIKCLNNKQWKIRDMAARTLSLLMDGESNDNETDVTSFFNDITTKNQNKLHGHLLLLKYLLQENNSLPDTKIEEVVRQIINKGNNLVLLNSNFVTVKAYLDLVNVIFDNFNHLISDDEKKQTVSIFGNYFIHYNSLDYVVNGSEQLCLSEVLAFLLKHETIDKLTISALGLESSFFEVQHVAIDYINRNNLLTEKESEIIDRLKTLLYDNNGIITIKPSIIKCLQKIKNALVFDDLLELLQNETSAECIKLAVIECIGQTVTDSESVSKMWKVVEPYLNDDVTYNFRIASLNCLINCCEKLQSPIILFNIHKVLFDDDIDLRLIAAKYLNDHFLPSNGIVNAKSPTVVAEVFGNEFVKKFDSKTIERIITDTIITYFTKQDLFTSVDHFIGLFDGEKDNQYRNDIEQLQQYIEVLVQVTDEPKSLQTFVQQYSQQLIEYLDSNNIQDEPLGWLDNIDTISPIVTLLTLQKHFGTLKPLQDSLSAHNCNPILNNFI